MHEGHLISEPAEPSPFTRAAARAREVLWHDAPVWFRFFFGWWAVPLVVFGWWWFLLAKFMHESKAELTRRRDARGDDFWSRGVR